MAKLRVGSRAPEFQLTDASGKKHPHGKAPAFTVIYFYPKDDTPGCTIEAKEFSAHLKSFSKAGIAVYGISGGDDASKAKFCKKHKLSVPLLSDSNFAVAKKFGAYGKKSFMGRVFNGILRMTFILDGANRVVKVFDKVKPEGHAEEVLQAVAELSAKTKTTPAKAEAKAKAKVVAAKTAITSRAAKRVQKAPVSMRQKKRSTKATSARR